LIDVRVKSLMIPVATLATVAAVAVPVSGAGASSAPLRSSSSLTSFHGTVTSVATGARTFRLRSANGTVRTFRVTSATVYERLSGGLSSLRGKAVEVKGRKADGRWTARKVEPDDDGAEHDAGDDHGGDRGGSGGSGGGGSDDGASHDAGDDHGSGGHGSDD
jgi:Domain of unknown function (DUF5666)